MRILHIVNRWSDGGVERFVEGLILSRVSDSFDQDILSICSPISLDAACGQYGPLVPNDSLWSFFAAGARLNAFLRENAYDVAHIHTNNSSGFFFAHAAKRAGVPVRVIHAHSSGLGMDAGSVKRAANRLLWTGYHGSETGRVACSRVAGEFLFRDAPFMLVNNGVDTEGFRFSGVARSRFRNRYGIPSDAFLVGCVGSLVPVKNHRRAVSIFRELVARRSSAALVFVGDGELRTLLEAEVDRQGLNRKVVFAGLVDDMREAYSALDVVLHPSFYEGLPMALVEAQCNGAPVVASDSVTEEVRLTDGLERLSLDCSDTVWADALLRAERLDPESALKAIHDKGYSKEDVVSGLIRLYRSAVASLGARS